MVVPKRLIIQCGSESHGVQKGGRQGVLYHHLHPLALLEHQAALLSVPASASLPRTLDKHHSWYSPHPPES